MLYFESRQGGQKSICPIKHLLLFATFLLFGCNSLSDHKDRNLTIESFSEMKTPAYVLNPASVKQQIRQLISNDKFPVASDRQVRDFYLSDSLGLLWIDRLGINHRADSLLSWFRQVGKEGLSENSFFLKDIEDNLNQLRQLNFDDSHSVIIAAASLEYNLTKACLRYCYGQRFGYINPYQVFNHLDRENQDSTSRFTKFRGLFDVDMDLPSKDYAQEVFRQIASDSLARYLHTIQPQGKYYQQLKDMLTQAPSDEMRQAIIVNLERSRWRLHHPIIENEKRIVVNIPAYHLYAFNSDSLMDMRVVCGNPKTKTPQLSSFIEYFEVNPKWVIPMSIIKNEVGHRAGDSSYFARHRYSIIDRQTGKTVDARSVSRQMLNSGKYSVAQKGGAGNSLGRVVFRFKNNFSVYLHDTSNPSAFQRESRGLSHGCVRVSRPFDLAHFVLGNPDAWLLDKIRIGMGITPVTSQGSQYVSSHPNVDDRNKIIGYVSVNPRVPLYIIYNTLWQDASGQMKKWPDVYGYDAVIWRNLQPYVQ